MNEQGYCAAAPISTKAGKECEYRQDCPANDGSTYAQCQCTFSQSLKRYCSILQGNSEWVAEFEAFKLYWNATKLVCNTAASWDECGGRSLEYNAWKCKYYQAYQYVDYLYKEDADYKLSLESCLQLYMGDMPEFKKVTSYCLTAESLMKYSGGMGNGGMGAIVASMLVISLIV